MASENVAHSFLRDIPYLKRNENELEKRRSGKTKHTITRAAISAVARYLLLWLKRTHIMPGLALDEYCEAYSASVLSFRVEGQLELDPMCGN
jgi:hypothetical protein